MRCLSNYFQICDSLEASVHEANDVVSVYLLNHYRPVRIRVHKNRLVNYFHYLELCVKNDKPSPGQHENSYAISLYVRYVSSGDVRTLLKNIYRLVQSH